MKIIPGSRIYHYAARVSVFLITVALIAGMAGCGGNGYTPPSQNLEIYDWYDLDAIRDNLAGNHTLMNDLDSNTPGYEELASPTANGGKGWDPIGTTFIEEGAKWDNLLAGTLDGQGYEIRDLLINQPDDYEVGLFGAVGREGVVKNIGVVNVTVTGGDCVGGIVGFNEGTVSNSYSSGSVTGEYSVGGLVGRNEYGSVMVSNSYFTGSVTGNMYVGGLVAWNRNEATVSNCYSTGNVTGNMYVGGLVGWNEEGTVSNSFWDIETSGLTHSDGGTGKNTTEMQNIANFSVAGWDITEVSLNSTNPAYTWNIVNNVTYPFLGWQL